MNTLEENLRKKSRNGEGRVFCYIKLRLTFDIWLLNINGNNETGKTTENDQNQFPCANHLLIWSGNFNSISNKPLGCNVNTFSIHFLIVKKLFLKQI